MGSTCSFQSLIRSLLRLCPGLPWLDPQSRGSQGLLMSVCLCFSGVSLAAPPALAPSSDPRGSIPSHSAPVIELTREGSETDPSSYTRPPEKASKGGGGSKRSAASSDSDQDADAGIDPSLFPRMIDFGKVNSSSLESDRSFLWGFDEELSSREVMDVEDRLSDSAELVFPAPSVSPSMTPQSVMIFEVEKKAPSPRPLLRGPLPDFQKK